MAQERPRLIEHLTRWLQSQHEPSTPTSSDFEQLRRELKPADVILMSGGSHVDHTLRTVTGCPWTHALLYVGRPQDIPDPDVRNTLLMYSRNATDTPLVLHTSLDRGAILEPLASFEHYALRICRPRSVSPRDAHQVIRYAASRLGPKPHYFQMLDLLRYLLPWSFIPKRWRIAVFRFNPGRHARAGTASLIGDAFSFIQYPILPLVKLNSDTGPQLFRRMLRLCLPSDIEHSPYFDIVKLPFLDFNDYPSVELLPWKGSGVLQPDSAILPRLKEEGATDNVLPLRQRDADH